MYYRINMIDIRNDLSDSFSLIKIMQNRIRNNKLVLFIVGGIMLIALLITIYMHIWRKLS